MYNREYLKGKKGNGGLHLLHAITAITLTLMNESKQCFATYCDWALNPSLYHTKEA